MNIKWIILLGTFCLSSSLGWAGSWQNEIRVEDGYRIDTLVHSGYMISPSILHFKQEIRDIGLFQINLEDRLTWNGCLFLKGLMGFGFSFHAKDHAHGTINVLVPPLTPNETPQPYDNQADSYDFFGKDVFKQKETTTALIRVAPSKEVDHLYSHRHGGAYTWTIDLALGGTISLSEYQLLEPRVGYTCQIFHVSHSTSTYLQGIYMGLAMPVAFKNFIFTPDISYMFWGIRHETIDFFCQYGSSYKPLHADQGNVLGFRGSLALEYVLTCYSKVGLVWKYSNFHTGSGKRIKINKAVSWKPHTEWQSQQFLASFTYFF
jgi:hypothetical protein